MAGGSSSVAAGAEASDRARAESGGASPFGIPSPSFEEIGAANPFGGQTIAAATTNGELDAAGEVVSSDNGDIVSSNDGDIVSSNDGDIVSNGDITSIAAPSTDA
jgi:hypothetical protein